jgi:hypothetical protein
MRSASDDSRRSASPRRAGAWIAPALAVGLALGACAQTPESIAPAPMDEGRYGYLTCPEMGHEMARLHRGLANLSTEQSAKRVNDAVGWTHLLHPAHSARVRDIRSWIALHKGELDAIERAMARRCYVGPVGS